MSSYDENDENNENEIKCLKYMVEICTDPIHSWYTQSITEYFIPSINLTINCSKNNFDMIEWNVFRGKHVLKYDHKTEDSVLPKYLINSLNELCIAKEKVELYKKNKNIMEYFNIKNT